MEVTPQRPQSWAIVCGWTDWSGSYFNRKLEKYFSISPPKVCTRCPSPLQKWNPLGIPASGSSNFQLSLPQHSEQELVRKTLNFICRSSLKRDGNVKRVSKWQDGILWNFCRQPTPRHHQYKSSKLLVIKYFPALPWHLTISTHFPKIFQILLS